MYLFYSKLKIIISHIKKLIHKSELFNKSENEFDRNPDLDVRIIQILGFHSRF